MIKMPFLQKRGIKIFVIFNIFIVVAILLAYSVFTYTDPYLDNVKQFVKTDASVQARVGDVKSLSRTNTRVSSAAIRTSGEVVAAYREYFFVVRGERRSAYVAVRVDNLDNPSTQKFSILSIENLWW